MYVFRKSKHKNMKIDEYLSFSCTECVFNSKSALEFDKIFK